MSAANDYLRGAERLDDEAFPAGYSLYRHTQTSYHGDTHTSYCAGSDAGVCSAWMSNRESALSWAVYQDRNARGLIPHEGELWESAHGLVVILGNCEREDGTYWAAVDATGEMVYLAPSELQETPKRHTRPVHETGAKVRDWAREGNADACYWLGFYYEYVPPQRKYGKQSLAYYVAAIRLDPELGRETGFRPFGDRYSLFCKNGRPDELDRAAADRVIRRFAEFKNPPASYTCGGDWREAIAIAEEE